MAAEGAGMKRAAVALLFALGAASARADIEVGAGLAHALPQNCGIWYDCGVAGTRLGLDSLDWSVGLAGDHWRAGYEHAGRFTTSALIYPDACQRSRCLPYGVWQGAGRLDGLYAEYVARLGHWHAEVGPWLYRADWTERYGRRGAYTAGAVTPGIIGGVGYDLGRYTLAATAKSCNAEGHAPDGGIYQSICKGAAWSLTARVRF